MASNPWRDARSVNLARTQARNGGSLPKEEALERRPLLLLMLPTSLELLDHPAAGRSGRIGGAIHGLQGQREPARRHVLNLEFDQSASLQIRLDGMPRHSTPSQSVQEKGVLGKKIGQAPGRRGHDAEFTPCGEWSSSRGCGDQPRFGRGPCSRRGLCGRSFRRRHDCRPTDVQFLRFVPAQDLDLRRRSTFRYTANGPESLLPQGKKVIIASTRGGIYTGDSPAAGLEHHESHLRGVLGFIGLTDITVIRAEGLNLGDEPKAAAIAQAKAQIAALAALSANCQPSALCAGWSPASRVDAARLQQAQRRISNVVSRTTFQMNSAMLETAAMRRSIELLGTEVAPMIRKAKRGYDRWVNS